MEQVPEKCQDNDNITEKQVFIQEGTEHEPETVSNPNITSSAQNTYVLSTERDEMHSDGNVRGEIESDVGLEINKDRRPSSELDNSAESVDESEVKNGSNEDIEDGCHSIEETEVKFIDGESSNSEESVHVHSAFEMSVDDDSPANVPKFDLILKNPNPDFDFEESNPSMYSEIAKQLTSESPPHHFTNTTDADDTVEECLHGNCILDTFQTDQLPKLDVLISDNISNQYTESDDLQFIDDICQLEETKIKYNTSTQLIHTSYDICVVNDDIPEQVGHDRYTPRSMITDFQEMKNQLTCLKEEYKSRPLDDDLGLDKLFDDVANEKQQKGTKTKASRKRKKQQKKLMKLAGQPNPSRRPIFAKSFQEIKQSTQCFDDELDSNVTCSVCLELYYLPSICSPCSHVFCDPCLRRLTTQKSEGIPCPLCRTIIARCDLDTSFNDCLMDAYTALYLNRAMHERNSKIRHQQLPFTPPVPLGKRLLRELIANRNNQLNSNWMSHDWFKFLLGCTVGICLSLLIMLLNRVKSINDVRDVNIMFLSCIFGACVTFVIFKVFKI